MGNIFSILIIIVSFASFLFFVRPHYQSARALKEQIQELEGALQNARRLQEIRDSLLQKQKSFSLRDLRRLEKLIPENIDNVKLILELQNIASRYNLSLNSASSENGGEQDKASGKKRGKRNQANTGLELEQKDYGSIVLNFTIRGGYQDFIAFLEEIENNVRINDVQGISISPGKADGEDYEFDVSFKTYWLKDTLNNSNKLSP